MTAPEQTAHTGGRESGTVGAAMKMFPILFGYRVKEEIAELRDALCVSMVIALPWPMLAAHERQAQKNHSQSVERLAQRGGLSPCEACAVLEDRPYRTIPLPEANARLKQLFEEWVKAGYPGATPLPERSHA